MTPERISGLRRTLVTISLLSAAWALLAALTGGFVVHLGGLTISSRNPQNPAWLALLSGLGAWALPMADRRRVLREAWQRWRDRAARVYARWPAWLDAAAVMAVLGIWFQVRVWIGGRPLWLDEEMIALNARDRGFGELAGALWLGQSAPFGWLALERLVMLTLGTSERAVRFVPVLFGCLTLVAAVWAGRRWTGPVGAAVFVLLCGLSAWLSHFPLEVKHYSADAFFGLLLPVLAAWAIEGRDAAHVVQRARIWWVVAAIGLWLANGAIAAAPACAIALLIAIGRRTGWRAALGFCMVGVVWLVSFGLHHLVSLRHALANPFLQSYWASGLPPDAIGVGGTIRWLASQLAPLADNPGGTVRWVVYWAAAVAGFALARRSLGVLLATAPLSAFVLGAFRVIPLMERLALWTVPAMYFGIGIFCDAAVRLLRLAYVRRRPAYLLPAALVVFIGVYVSSDIVTRGMGGIRSRSSTESNHGFHDRAAVQWLMSRRQSGDALMTTHLGLPAVWWYGALPLNASERPGTRTPDGGTIFEAGYVPGSDCASDRLDQALAGQRRVLVYTGFDDQPAGFDDLLLLRLERIGVVTADQRFGDISRVAIVELGQSAAGGPGDAFEPRRAAPRLDGCIVAGPARRW